MSKVKVSLKINGVLMAYIYAFCLFILTLPYFVWHMEIARYVANLLMLIVSLYFINTKISKNNFLLTLLLFFVILLGLRDSTLKTFVSAFLILFIMLLKDSSTISILNAYKNICVVVFSLSLIVYFLVNFILIPLPYSIIDPVNPVKEGFYRVYPFLVSYDTSYNFIHLRFASLFDEPGVVGTISTILLYGENYNLRKPSNIILFIAGFFSFSMFFYIMMIVALLFRYTFKKSIIYVIILTIILCALKDNEAVNNLVFSRFNLEKSNTRTGESFSSEYRKFIASDDLLWGMGQDKLSNVIGGASSYKTIIFSKGLFYFSFVLFFFFLLFFSKNLSKKDLLWIVILFLCTIYQRPSMLSQLYFFLYLSTVNKVRSINHEYSLIEKL